MALAPDTAFGAFSDAGPWVVDPDALAWRRSVAGVRARLVPRSPPHPAAHAAAGPPARYHACGTWAARSGCGTSGSAGAAAATSVAGISRRLRVAAERLGPTYIKLGQIIASGDGIFPPELVAEFKWCRDQVPAEPWPVVERVLTEELGGPLAGVFASVEHTPLAAASIAQVHAATLRDGTPVVVKVQRPDGGRRACARTSPSWPGWRRTSSGRIPVAALANPPALVELFAETIVEELDFRLEAENMLDIAMTFAALDQRDFVVPRPHPTLVTRRMLVMERLDGFHFADVEGMQRGRHRHRGGGARRHDRLPRGRACSTASSTATCTAGTSSCCRRARSRCWTSASPAA